MNEVYNAELTGCDQITILGHTYRHRTPIFYAARILANQGLSGKINVYRDGALACPGTIERMAGWTVTENEKTGPKFSKWQPMLEELKGDRLQKAS